MKGVSTRSCWNSTVPGSWLVLFPVQKGPRVSTSSSLRKAGKEGGSRGLSEAGLKLRLKYFGPCCLERRRGGRDGVIDTSANELEI